MKSSNTEKVTLTRKEVDQAIIAYLHSKGFKADVKKSQVRYEIAYIDNDYGADTPNGIKEAIVETTTET